MRPDAGAPVTSPGAESLFAVGSLLEVQVPPRAKSGPVAGPLLLRDEVDISCPKGVLPKGSIVRLLQVGAPSGSGVEGAEELGLVRVLSAPRLWLAGDEEGAFQNRPRDRADFKEVKWLLEEGKGRVRTIRKGAWVAQHAGGGAARPPFARAQSSHGGKPLRVHESLLGNPAQLNPGSAQALGGLGLGDDEAASAQVRGWVQLTTDPRDLTSLRLRPYVHSAEKRSYPRLWSAETKDAAAGRMPRSAALDLEEEQELLAGWDQEDEEAGVPGASDGRRSSEKDLREHPFLSRTSSGSLASLRRSQSSSLLGVPGGLGPSSTSLRHVDSERFDRLRLLRSESRQRLRRADAARAAALERDKQQHEETNTADQDQHIAEDSGFGLARRQRAEGAASGPPARFEEALRRRDLARERKAHKDSSFLVRTARAPGGAGTSSSSAGIKSEEETKLLGKRRIGLECSREEKLTVSASTAPLHERSLNELWEGRRCGQLPGPHPWAPRSAARKEALERLNALLRREASMPDGLLPGKENLDLARRLGQHMAPSRNEDGFSAAEQPKGDQSPETAQNDARSTSHSHPQ